MRYGREWCWPGREGLSIAEAVARTGWTSQQVTAVASEIPAIEPRHRRS